MELKYKEIISIFCCGCGSWSVAVREGNRLCVFGSRVRGKIYGREREEVTRNWRKVQGVQIHNL